MANKPSILESRFAVDGSDVDSPNIGTGPSGGLRDAGYVVDDVPKSSDFDYLFNKYYRWMQYLNDGQFSGLSSFDEDVTVGGQSYSFAGKTFTAHVSPPSFNFDYFIAVGHSLHTGDGPVRVSNSGGALPTGLVAATDYWVIKLTADRFLLATTRARSFANVSVAISGVGSGTQTLSSTGGTLRARDLDVTGSLIVGGSTTVDEIYHGPITKTFCGASGVSQSSVTRENSGAVTTVGANEIVWQFPMASGSRLLSGVIRVTGDGAVDMTWTIDVWNVLESPTNLDSGAVNNAPLGTIFPEAIVPTTFPTIVDPDRLVLRINSSGADLMVTTISLTYDRPPPS